MGDEIANFDFTQDDFNVFQQHLSQQTRELKQWFENGRFGQTALRCGFELEAWLIDKQCQPAGLNQAFLAALGDDLVTPELANFNIEFNFTPQSLSGLGLKNIHQEMRQRWSEAQAVAQAMDLDIAIIGILPTVSDSDLSTSNISGLHRYQAINEQVLKLRGGRPMQLDIHGADILRTTQNDVMLESAATSFQIHFQVPLAAARRVYNASLIASAPLLALSANSPYLFGKDLWHETRIPLFEQSVEVGGYELDAHGPMRRVTFGSGYVINSLIECFEENLEHYPVLLPTIVDKNDPFNYVRMHNGTLWRWNRPLIGIENGQYHVRIENRVVPAGPSILDCMANAAMYYGLVYWLSISETDPEFDISFPQARDNFYNAAQRGLSSHIIWRDGIKKNANTLILQELLPQAALGLQKLNVDQDSINKYLTVIEQRVKNNQNGTNWQHKFVEKYGNDMHQLTQQYIENQNSGFAVHEWTI